MLTLDDLLKRTEHLIQQSVECMLKQMLKTFKRALSRSNKIQVTIALLYSAWDCSFLA